MELLLREAAAWGIVPGYHDIAGRWVEADPDVVSQALAAMGARGQAPAPAAVLVLRAGTGAPLSEPAEVVTEDGATLRAAEVVPADLPTGYHTLRRLRDGAVSRLIVGPGRCHLPPDLRAWGWAVQLYAVRSRASWGIGDLADLRQLAGWSSGLGAGMLLLNPLCGPLPLPPVEPSPYYPSSRRFRNPLYLRIEEVPGAERLGERLAPLAAAGRELNGRRRIDRDRVHDLKMRALEELFDAFGGGDAFDRHRSETPGLRDYATFCALAEEHGTPWGRWPAELRHPRSPAVSRFRAERRRRVRFHEWLQWLLDVQLAAASQQIALVHDLPIGVRADGADAWAWQDVLAQGVSVGAPPDPFNQAGQNWAVPPFDPWRLRAAGYEPFVQTVQAALRHGGGLRIDHVMGLFRLYWIPAEAGPDRGVYVRYPYRELLEILALESQRALAFVVGEDLGTVEDVVREEMAARRMLSCRLLWFQDRAPRDYPRDSLAALTTHDLPTLAGIWEGTDPDQGILDRLRRATMAADGQSTEEVAEAAYRALASGPSCLVTATLEDALGVRERPNRPGTTSEWPNWSLALPAGLEEIESDPRPSRLARALARP